jgi:hypothetical protein
MVAQMTHGMEGGMAGAGVHTLRICQAGPQRFEIRDNNGGLMGVAANEAKAMTSAMFSADLIGQQGVHVRVVADHDGDVEEVYAVRRGR